MKIKGFNFIFYLLRGMIARIDREEWQTDPIVPYQCLL